MLPYFPKVREYADKLLYDWFNRRMAEKTGIMRDIKYEVIHEGHRMGLHRFDGSTECTPLKKIETAIRIGDGDLKKRPPGGTGGNGCGCNRSCKKAGRFFLWAIE